MCGIVAGITQRPLHSILLEGLKHLEYRGYDSAGMALIDVENQQLLNWRVKGKVINLENELKQSHAKSHLGIAHTRWATHGIPAQRNAHPHLSANQYAIVHNGIIENYQELKKKLITKGYEFHSDTDSEVIVHLLHCYAQQHEFIKAFEMTCHELKGAYSIACIDQTQPNRLFAVRQGSPLVIGVGIGENFVASDTLALLPVTQRFIYLQEGDFAILTQDTIDIRDAQFNAVKRHIQETNLQAETLDKQQFRHHMLKEIHQQPHVAQQTLDAFLGQEPFSLSTLGQKAPHLLPHIQRIHIVACGTSFHAGLVAQHWIETIAQLPTQVDIASEHRYRQRVVEKGTLLVALSQSGETADTLAALRNAQNAGYAHTLGICNVPLSSLAREADMVLLTRAGIEIGVAATKTFTAQLIALLGFAITLAKFNGNAALVEQGQLALQSLPNEINNVLHLNDTLKNIAVDFINKNHAIFLGRGIHYPIAMEGALKLKEISYLHAESYAAGELKHGPLALIDSDMPVVVVAPPSDVLDKVISNIKEVEARGGQLIIFSHHSIDLSENDNIKLVHLDEVNPLISPIIYNIPLQLLAYHIAVYKGTDIDQPRNLAKSVTVE